jgi:lytic murein transglycosylase
MRRIIVGLSAFAVWLVVASASPALAAPCGGAAGFPAWLEAFKKDAAAQKISQATIASALNSVTYDPRIIALDHKQGYFHQSFERYRATRVTPAKVQMAASLLRANAGLFQRIEQRFGVPGPILVAIWGLETGFGAGSGNTPSIRSLATLASDCRRSEFFQNELVAALKIVDRGDQTAAGMHGGWAGEVGQTQFLPSSYMKFAVDFDGDGKRDLIRSSADALASTANYLKGYGWHAGQPWTEGSANFQVLLQWNKAQVYCKTIAYFASQLVGR